jgi:zinc protease
MKRIVLLLLLLVLPIIEACGGADVPPPQKPTPPPPPRDVMAVPQAEVDPLGARPTTPEPPPFTPPVPTVYKHASGVYVWLLERHTLPIVSWQLVVPGASRIEKKEGVAWATANMLDEGAGTRGPLEIARDLDRLGATLSTGSVADYSFAQLTVLVKNLGDAAKIFSDVIAKPTFAPNEWTRVQNLWLNDLKQRPSDPSAVARVVLQRKVFPPGHPYGAPANGTIKNAAKVTLADLKSFHEQYWRPSRSTIVVVGDVTRAQLDPVLDATFGPWAASDKNPRSEAETWKQTADSGRRVFIVDRPDAPQSVIAVGRRGVKADSPDAPPLVRINSALGGSFTSRLNQDLREEHGWSYGAGSRFSWTRQEGIFSAQAAVHTEHTGDALKAMLADIDALAKDGLTDEEVAKSRQLARADLVESFEGVEAAASRLARNAGVGLSASHEADASKLLYGATKADLQKLAVTHLDLSQAVVVVVGPKAKVLPQLEKIGLTKVETTGPEGE